MNLLEKPPPVNSEVDNKNRADITVGPVMKKLGARSRHDVLLVDRRRYELESVEPLHVLHVVAVGPEGVRNVVRAGGHASTKAVAGVDVLSGHDVGTAAQVADDV